MSKSVSGFSQLSFTQSTGTLPSRSGEEEGKARSQSGGKVPQFVTALFGSPQQAAPDISAKGSGHVRQRSLSTGAADDAVQRERAFASGAKITKASSKALPLATKRELSAPGELKESLKGFNELELRSLLSAGGEKIRGGGSDPLFISLIEASMRQRLQTFDPSLLADISACMEKTTVMVGMDEYTFLALDDEEQFDEKCQEFLKLLNLFCSAVTLPEIRAQVWSELLNIWDRSVAEVKTKTIDNESFKLCLKQFLEILGRNEEYHKTKLSELFLSFFNFTYIFPTREITALLPTELQKQYAAQNVRLKFLLDEKITLLVRWEVKIVQQGLLLFTHALETKLEKLPHWESSIRVEFKAGATADLGIVQYLILNPLIKAGLKNLSLLT